MRFVIVTGMSGAGKSSVMKMLEDVGYFCVDNLPSPLVPKFAELFTGPEAKMKKVALGMDSRSVHSAEEIDSVLKGLDETGIEYEVLFLDAYNEVLIKRYKETRRSHPVAGSERVDYGIEVEREILEPLKSKATYILDTSRLLIRELKSEINQIFVENKQYKNMYVTVLSFGFKYGIPSDADLVFDVRFLPNPYYIEELREKSGNDKEVQDYVMNNEAAKEFLGKLTSMVEFLLPNYVKEGKTQLVIAIGCTGGKHRSVTLANGLFHELQKSSNEYGWKIEHRDIPKDAITKAR